MREVWEEAQDGSGGGGVAGVTAQKRREGVEVHCGVRFLRNVSPRAYCPPQKNVGRIGRQVCAAAGRALFAHRRGRQVGEEGNKGFPTRQYWGFIFIFSPVALMGPLPRLGSGPERVPCVPQMGLLSKGTRRDVMCRWPISLEKSFRDNWLKTAQD